MARITAGEGFGRDVAEPMRMSERAMPSAAFGVVRALRARGDELVAEGEEADKARSNRIIAGAALDFGEAGAEVADRVRTGQVRADEADAEWAAKSADVRARLMAEAPRKHGELIDGVLQHKTREIGIGVVKRAVIERRKDEQAADLGATLEALARREDLNLAAAAKMAGDALDGSGPGAGMDPRQIATSKQNFRESKAAFNAERLLIRAGNPQALEEAAQRLAGDEFNDITPSARLRLEHNVASLRERFEQQAYTNETRARVEQDRQETLLYGTAQLQVETKGRVDPALWIQLKDGHRASLLDRAKAEARQRRNEAEGRPVKTDWSLYLELREQAVNDPAKFAAVDLKRYVDRLAGGQLEQLADIKGRQLIAGGKVPREAVTLTQQTNATMQALGITKPAAKGKFLSFVQQAIDDGTHAKGKPLTFDERQGVIDRAVLQGPDPDAWLWGTKRMFELSPDQRARFKPTAATDAPATELEALNEALKAQGLPQTAANRMSLYSRVTKGQQ